jgi:dTMP kinase
MKSLAGKLIAIEGIDQAGKQTVATGLVQALREVGARTWVSGFPRYETHLGQYIDGFLHGRHTFPLQARHLLYAANRRECVSEIVETLELGYTVVLDRYFASGVAYGAAQGLEMDWMLNVEYGIPVPDLTILLDITPEVSAARKQHGRDAYEANLDLLARVREAYLAMAQDASWVIVDADASKEAVQQRAVEALGRIMPP